MRSSRLAVLFSSNLLRNIEPVIASLIVEVGNASLEVSSWRQLFNFPDRHILSLFILDKLALLKTAPLQPMIAVFKVVHPNASKI